MNWLFPAFLAGAAAVLLPLLLHLLRRRPVRRQPFPALRFFNGARPADQRRHRLRRWLVLALRCGVFALLAMMFARPFFRRFAPPSRATVVIVDNSFSLQAGDRWKKLRDWAGETFGPDQPGETVGILLTSPRPTWLVAPTRDVRAARQALAQFQPGWQASRFGPALDFAADDLLSRPSATKRIIFLGDHQAVGWHPRDFVRQLPPGIELSFPPIAAPVGIQAALDPPSVTREGDTVTVEAAVRSFSGHRRRSLAVFIGNALKPAATAPVDPASGHVSVSFKVRDGDAWLRCLLDADDLPADDEAWAIIPAPGNLDAPAVLFDRLPAGAGADYLVTAYESLSALPGAPRTGILPAAAWPAAGVAVLRNDASFAGGPAAKLDAFLAQGGQALIFPTGGPAQARWLAGRQVAPTPVAGDARIRDWSVEHPLVAPLAERGLRSLVGWQFSRGWSLPANAVEPLAFWSDGSPALGEFSAGKGRVLLAGFSPDRRDGDWPVGAAFVPFLHRAALHLLKTQPGAAEAPHQVGMPIVLPEGAGAWQRLSEAKLAGDLPVKMISQRVVPAAPGVFEWKPANGTRRLYAVNVPAEESDLTPWREGTPWLGLAGEGLPPRRLNERAVVLAAQQSEQQSRLWWWCLALAAVFLLSELSLANRTSR